MQFITTSSITVSAVPVEPDPIGTITPTASASIPICSFPNVAHPPVKPRKCVAAAKSATTASSSRSRTARSSASGAGSPSESAGGSAASGPRSPAAPSAPDADVARPAASTGAAEFAEYRPGAASRRVDGIGWTHVRIQRDGHRPRHRPGALRRLAVAEARQEPGQGAEGIQRRHRRGRCAEDARPMRLQRRSRQPRRPLLLPRSPTRRRHRTGRLIAPI